MIQIPTLIQYHLSLLQGNTTQFSAERESELMVICATKLILLTAEATGFRSSCKLTRSPQQP